MGLRILVIEDNPANLELMGYLLRAAGHEVVSAADGLEGLARVARDRPDLVICDIQIPGLDGFGVASRLKADPALAGIPLVAVTAFAMVGDRDRMLSLGFDGYLAKPINPRTFCAEVAGLAAAGLGAAPRPPRAPEGG